MELMDYRRLYTCDKMSIVHDHKDNHKVVGQNSLTVTKGQFCAMFYHVAERESERDKISFKCLEKSKCKIGNLKVTKRLHSNPRARAQTVVVYVRLTDRTGQSKFRARYGNCFKGKKKKYSRCRAFYA